MDSVDIVLDSKYDAENTLLNDRSPQKFLRFAINIDSKRIVGFNLLWVNVPFTYYNINPANWEFILTVNNASTYTCRFDAQTLVVGTLQDSFTKALIHGGVPDAASYRVAVIPSSQKLVIYHPSLPLRVTWLKNTLSDQLGFADADNSTYVSEYGAIPGVSPNQNFILSPYVINFLGCMVLSLETSLRGTNFAPSTRLGDENSLVRFPVNANFGEIISFRNKSRMIPVDIRTQFNLDLRLEAGDRREFGHEYNGELQYAPNNTSVPLNGEGFQVGIRLYQRLDYQSNQ